MSLPAASIRRPVTVGMFTLALLVFGGVSLGRLPLTLLPEITYPTLTIETTYPGAAPGEVEELVTRQIEEAVGVVGGVQRIVSRSRAGLSQVVLEFPWDAALDFAALEVREKLDLLHLPEEAGKPNVLRYDPNNDPILRYALTGGEDLVGLRIVAENTIKKELEALEGVAAVKINGGYEEEIRIEVDEGRLHAFGLDFSVVKNRLAAENVNVAGGSLYEAEARYLVRTNNAFADIEEIRNTILYEAENRLVRLRDVAEVFRGFKDREVITRIDGAESVELAIYKEGDANVVAVARQVRERLADLPIPPGIRLVPTADQSRFIERAVQEVISNALVGGGIAILVLYLFLGDLRSTVIIGLSIPVSIVGTFFLMYRTHVTMNVMSLGGLALGVGMLVDNAIVVLESIFRFREGGQAPRRAAERGAEVVSRAVTASTLTTVAVFLPIIFVEGVAAQLFRDQALTVTFSLLVSLLVSLTLIPALAARGGGSAETEEAMAPPGRWGWFTHTVPRFLLRTLRRGIRGIGWGLFQGFRPFLALVRGFLSALDASYPRLLGLTLRFRWLAILSALILLFLALSRVSDLGFELIPSLTEGTFAFDLSLPEGTPLEVTDRITAGIEREIGRIPGIVRISTIVGGRGLTSSGSEDAGENMARIDIEIEDRSDPAEEARVIAEVRERLARVENLSFEFRRPSTFSFKTPVSVEIYGDDLDDLAEAVTILEKRLSGVRGLTDLRSNLEGGNPELQIRFDRLRLARLDLAPLAIGQTLREKIGGTVATRYLEGDREIDIRVRDAAPWRSSVARLRGLIVAVREGRPVRLGTIATISLGEGPPEIRRIGQRRAAVIEADLAGRDLGSVAEEIERLLAATPLPDRVLAVLGGQNEEMKRSLRSLILALLLAVFLVYLVMASQFESLLHPFVILLSVPLASIGVVGVLSLTHRPVSVLVMIGVVMLAGIVVNNAIVLIDTINRLRAGGMAREAAIVHAGRLRMRPILMTTVTTVLGLVPMALGRGEGAEIRAPLALTVIGGLCVSTLLTLLVIPAVYTLLDRKRFVFQAGEAEALE
ncbi:MAG: efflux RND transporter permease subunit [Deltaproteobacteria bacterium]|nr:MAG: efflux RND transporter permease subunit [Deltaproteobacteria bacterium]